MECEDGRTLSNIVYYIPDEIDTPEKLLEAVTYAGNCQF